MEIKVLENILKANDDFALKNRKIFKEKCIFAVNLIGSPGSGKTTLIEKTVREINTEQINIAVIEGDIATTRDSERIAELGIHAIQINTGNSCHIDANLIHKALLELDLDKIDILFIENVGNLVCPAEFDIGEDVKVAILSTTEGDDKPLKYPLLFRESSCLILNKIDLIPYTNFNKNRFYDDIAKLNGDLKVFETECTSGRDDDGIKEWIEWFKKGLKDKG